MATVDDATYYISYASGEFTRIKVRNLILVTVELFVAGEEADVSGTLQVEFQKIAGPGPMCSVLLNTHLASDVTQGIFLRLATQFWSFSCYV